jgi:hypothetical protein
MNFLIIGGCAVSSFGKFNFGQTVHVECYPTHSLQQIIDDPLILPIILTEDRYDGCVLVLDPFIMDHPADLYPQLKKMEQLCVEAGIKWVLFTEIPGHKTLNTVLRDVFHQYLVPINISASCQKKYTWDDIRLSAEGSRLLAANIACAISKKKDCPQIKTTAPLI